MKRFFIAIVGVALLMPGRAFAQAPASAVSTIDLRTPPVETKSSFPTGFAVGVSVGAMDGIGAELALGLSEKINVRAGYSFFPNKLIKEYEVSLPAWGVNPASDNSFTARLTGSANLLLDFHPWSRWFRISAGVFVGPGDFLQVYNTKPLPDSYRAAGINYYVDCDKDDLTKYYRIQANEDGIMKLAFRTASVKPFVGIGFGSSVPSDRIGASFDLGVEYIGGMELHTTARNIKGDFDDITLTTDGLMLTVKEIQKNPGERSYDKYIDMVDKLRALPVLPVARFTLFVKLF